MDDESRKFTELYSSLMKGDKSKVIEKYKELGLSSAEELSIYGDTILHMAIYLRQESIAREILLKYNPSLTKQNALGDTILHEAVEANMTRFAKELLELAPNLLSMRNKNQETPLFRAVHFGHTKMFELLADLVDNKGEAVCLHWTNKVGSTILHMAILSEFFHLALKITMRCPDLVKKEDGDRMNGLQLLSYNSSAFRSGRKYGLLKRFIYYCIPSEEDIVGKEDSPRQKGPELPPMHIICLHFYFTMVHALTSVVRKINISIWKFLCQVWPMMERIYKEKKKHESALKLAKFLIAKDRSWKLSSNKEDTGKTNPMGDIIPALEPEKDEKLKGTTLTPLLIATSTGIVEIVKEILRVYPQAVDHVTPDKNWNILHVAISHRQLEIFRIVRKMEIPMARLVRRIDADGHTILHHVGVMEYYAGGTVPGPVLQLQEELLWFERVQKIIPSHYQMHRCQIKQKTAQTHQFAQEALAAEIHHIPQHTEASPILSIHEISESEATQTAEDKQFKEIDARIFKGVQEFLKRTSQNDEASQTAQTARELFEQTHAVLLKEAQEWLKRTSEACSAVAVLIATVAFAAAYTVPGGSNQDTGVPILLHDPFFLVFTVMDVLSLASSLTSVVMFLSILTSPFELPDFRHSLPQKLTLGFTFLFFSVAVTMLAFAATIILIIHLKKRWTTTLIYTAAFLPVSVFALLQFPLYVAFMSTVKFSWKVIRSVLPSCFLPSRFKNTTTGSIYKTL